MQQTGARLTHLFVPTAGRGRPLATAPRHDVYGPSFQELCLALRRPTVLSNVELTLRINGISDAASTAEAIGVPAVELAAALQWTRIHRMQKRVFAGEPFTELTPKAAHVWAATMAHCIASSKQPQSDLIPPHTRLLDFVPEYKFGLDTQAGTYMRRHTAANSTFQMLCAQLGNTGWRTGAFNFEIPPDYGLGPDRRSVEQQAAVDWATWLDQEPPVCMAGHIMALHAEDLQVLIALARTAWADGRRGANSLYGIVVRAVYHAFTLFVLNGSGAGLPIYTGGQAFVRGGGISFQHDLPPSHPAAGA